MDFALRNKQPKIIAGIELSSTLNVDLDTERYSLSDLEMLIKASGPTIPGNDQQLELTLTSVGVDLKKETLQLDKLLLNVMGIELNTSMQASHILDEQLQATGELQLGIKSLRNMMGPT